METLTRYCPSGLLKIDEALMIVATKIVLPTLDIITDILTIENVLTITNELPSWMHETVYSIGYCMMFFVLLSYIMVLPTFLRVEKTRKQRLKALPFLLLSSWPQYRGLRLLYWSYIDKNANKLIYEKLIFEQDLSHIGKSEIGFQKEQMNQNA